jgi:hypothetical protein
VHRELRDIKADNPDADLVVVAHSFGTYIIARILESFPDLRLKRLLLCGSIIPRAFRWDRVKSQVGDVVNDCGTHDIWPVLAQSVTWGYGASGTFGFGSSRVRDRFHKFAHSEYFNAAFVEHYWTPFLISGTVISSRWDVKRPAAPWWHSILAIFPLRYVAVALCALAVVAAVANGQPEPSNHQPRLLDARLSGVVHDSSSLPIMDAVVTVNGYPTAVPTGSDGTFVFDLPQTQAGEPVRFRIAKHPYESASFQVVVKDNDVSLPTVVLKIGRE